MKMYRKCLGVFMALFLGLATAGWAEPVLTNGSFETGDYSGWGLAEGTPADFGTWAIVNSGQTVDSGDWLYDFCDGLTLSQISSGLPKTFDVSDGDFMALQLQRGGQEHRLYQDVTLPENASALSWDMLYHNLAAGFFPDQYLAVHIRDLDDTILETLYVTADGAALKMPMTNFTFDISGYAGETVRLDVEMKVHRNFFDAGFDNFRIVLDEEAEQGTAPPGWSKSHGKKLGWAKNKKEKTPKGFGKGLKKGWDK